MLVLAIDDSEVLLDDSSSSKLDELICELIEEGILLCDVFIAVLDRLWELTV